MLYLFNFSWLDTSSSVMKFSSEAWSATIVIFLKSRIFLPGPNIAVIFYSLLRLPDTESHAKDFFPKSLHLMKLDIFAARVAKRAKVMFSQASVILRDDSPTPTPPPAL